MSHDDIFSEFFSPDYIQEIYKSKIRFSAGSGIDKLSWKEFEKLEPDFFDTISEKVLSGTYQFSPYLEKLISKGRNRYPRIISIPTIRDKITLTIINKYLQGEFSYCINRTLPNHRIKNIANFLREENGRFSIVRTDFLNFYGSIEHSLLLSKLKNIDVHLFSLVYKAITNPTVPTNSSRSDRDKYIQRIGVPQGLPISNILAEIYIHDIDDNIRSHCLYYDRYIDDILAFTRKPKKLLSHIEKSFSEMCLSFNKEKTFTADYDDETTYLGYSISKGTISVKKSNFEKFLSNIDKLFVQLRSDISNARRKKYKDEDELKERIKTIRENFLTDLNIKIAGAFYNQKRYGWIFYFSVIDDLSILYRIDSYVEKKIRKAKQALLLRKVKKIVRAYYHIKGRTEDHYSHSFNITNTQEMREVLTKRGLIYPSEKPTRDEIRSRYHKFVSRKLSELDEDLGRVYL